MQIENLSLRQIEQLGINEQTEFLKEYKDMIKKWMRISKARNILIQNPDASLEQLWYLIENELADEYNHNHERVILYPNIQEKKAKKPLICAVSGDIIYPGNDYYRYRPLIYNVRKDIRYSLTNSLKVRIEYYDFLPKTIVEFEELNHKLENPFLYMDEEYDYVAIAYRTGGLHLTKFRQKEKQKHILY